MTGVLVAVGSVKGAPGVTTLAVALAGLWPGDGAVLLECDGDGGDVAARFGLHPDPGLARLALTVRACVDDPAGLAAHAQRLPIGVDVVLAPPGEPAAASVAVLAGDGGRALSAAAKPGRPVIADVGRLSRDAAATPIAAAADHLLLVARPTLDDLTQVAARLDWLRDTMRGRVWLVLSGPGPYSEPEVRRDLGVPVAAVLPRDKLGAGVLAGRYTGKGWRRLRLPRAARSAALTLAETGAGAVGPARRQWRTDAVEVER